MNHDDLNMFIQLFTAILLVVNTFLTKRNGEEFREAASTDPSQNSQSIRHN